MSAVGAIWRRHSPDGGIQWLQVKPWSALLDNAPRVIPLHRHGNQNCQRFAFIFGVADFIVAKHSS
jgi:hypothetical protein